MRMTRRLAVTIAVACGLLAAVLTWAYLRGLQKSQAPPVTLQVQVVTPLATIQAGTVIKAEMLRVQEIPEDQKPPGAVQQVQRIVGDVAAEDLPAAEPIKLTQMASQRGGVELSFVVPPRMRAVTVALDPIIGVAGFLQPGDHVDVLATFQLNDTIITRTVLQNVELLALGEQTIVSKERAAEKEGEEEPKAQTQPNATLAVTPQDAQKLIISDTTGTIRLALRRKGETEYRPVKPTHIVSVIGVEYSRKEGEEEQPMPPERAEASLTEEEVTRATIEVERPPALTVEVIRGTEREIVAP